MTPLRPVQAAAVSALFLTLPALPALAQDEDKPSADEATSVMPPITVEARQWTEEVDRVPGSVDVLTWDRLETPLWEDVGAIPKLSPNVQIEESSVQTRVVIRGMTSANTALQDPVGYLVNGVVLPMGASQAPRLFDVEQMEISKGPQGDLFGRNTEAGAIRVTTNDPSWTPTAWASLTPSLLTGAGRWEPVYTGAGGVSGALIDDRLAGSLALRAESTEGIHHNDYDGAEDGGDTDRWTLSGGLSARIGDRTEAVFKSVIEQRDLGKQRMRYRTGRNATDAYTTNYNTDAWEDQLTAVQSLRVDHHFDTMDLTSITGWTHYDRDMQMDLDTGPMPTLPTLTEHHDDALSQELRLTTADPEARWRWLAGLHVFRQWTDMDFRMGTPRIVRDLDLDQTGIAGFGQVEVRLLEDLRLGVGSRVEWVHQSGEMTLSRVGGTSRFGDDLDTVTVLPRVTLAYDVRPDVMLYGSVARGYLPGGYNYSMAVGKDSLTYDPEYSWTVEAGVKARLLDDRLRVGLAGFRTVTEDKQIIDLEPGGTQKFSNAGEAEIYGVEGSLNARVTQRWSLFGTLGLQHAEATDYKTTVSQGGRQTQVDLSGNALPMAADVTWSAGVAYNEGTGWFGQASLNGSGSYAFDSQNTLEQDAFVKVDAEIGYRFESVEVAVWGANLSGENVYSRAIGAPMGVVVEDGAPREIGLRVRMTW